MHKNTIESSLNHHFYIMILDEIVFTCIYSITSFIFLRFSLQKWHEWARLFKIAGRWAEVFLISMEADQILSFSVFDLVWDTAQVEHTLVRRLVNDVSYSNPSFTGLLILLISSLLIAQYMNR